MSTEATGACVCVNGGGACVCRGGGGGAGGRGRRLFAGGGCASLLVVPVSPEVVSYTTLQLVSVVRCTIISIPTYHKNQLA